MKVEIGRKLRFDSLGHIASGMRYSYLLRSGCDS